MPPSLSPIPIPIPIPVPIHHTHVAARGYAVMLVYVQTKRHISISQKVPKQGATLVPLHIDLYSASPVCLPRGKCYGPPISHVVRRVPYESDTWHLA